MKQGSLAGFLRNGGRLSGRRYKGCGGNWRDGREVPATFSLGACECGFDAGCSSGSVQECQCIRGPMRILYRVSAARASSRIRSPFDSVPTHILPGSLPSSPGAPRLWFPFLFFAFAAIIASLRSWLELAGFRNAAVHDTGSAPVILGGTISLNISPTKGRRMCLEAPSSNYNLRSRARAFLNTSAISRTFYDRAS